MTAEHDNLKASEDIHACAVALGMRALDDARAAGTLSSSEEADSLAVGEVRAARRARQRFPRRLSSARE